MQAPSTHSSRAKGRIVEIPQNWWLKSSHEHGEEHRLTPDFGRHGNDLQPIAKFYQTDGGSIDKKVWQLKIYLITYICHYFDIHVCLSLRHPSSAAASRPTFEFPIPAGVWQSVTNKSWLVCVKSEKYTFLVTTRPLGTMRWREGELHTFGH